MNAGQAWRTSSCCQPGSALKVVGVSGATGAGGVSGAGGCAGGAGGTPTGPTGGGIRTGGGCGLAGSGCGCGVVLQALTRQTSAVRKGTLDRVAFMNRTDMWILMVEAGVALFLLVFIVWWTMFAGRKEVDEVDKVDVDADADADAAGQSRATKDDDRPAP
jgi:hypothetical protein